MAFLESKIIGIMSFTLIFHFIPEVGFDLAYPHVDAAVVLADVKVKVLVLDPEVLALRQLPLEASVICAELVSEVSQRVPELDHALGRDGDLRPGNVINSTSDMYFGYN